MRTPLRHVALLATLLPGALPWTSAAVVERTFEGPYIENDELLVVLVPRSPEQMAAFYEARGFPRAAIDRIRQTCFVTVHIKNKSRDVIWLDTDQWRFTGDGKPLTRLDDSYWRAQWNEIDLRQASRSTFGWTQLPPVRDLQPDEPVGGNLVFPGDTNTLTIEATLPTGADRQGEPISVGFGSIRCSKGADNP
ncbi:MAG: hypothetical protein WBO37_07690 [Gammaproteobacteria bacterium]